MEGAQSEFASPNDLYFEVDPGGRIVAVNPRAMTFFGRSLEQITNHHLLDLVDQEDRAQLDADQPFDPDNWEGVEIRWVRGDGISCWFEMITASKAPHGGDRFQLIARDINERKSAEHALRESEAVLRSIMESSIDHIMLIDLAGHIKFINRTVSDLRVTDVLDTEIYQHVEPRYRPMMRECFQGVIETRSPGRYEVEYLNSETDVLHVFESRVGPVVQDDQVVALTIAATDITQRRQVEAELREQGERVAQVGRLSSMGEMVAGIAHEVNQPLAAIANFAGACRRLILKGDFDTQQLVSWLDEISEEANRTGDIIRRLRSVVKKTDTELRVYDIRQIIEDSLLISASALRRAGVQMQVVPADDTIDVLCDAVQIQQVIVNLLLNASEALANSQEEERRVEVRFCAVNESIQVSVIDNGPGVPAAIATQLFDRFVTSKKDGLGMGLAISRSIVEDHDGEMWADTERERGAAFYFTLPKD